MILQSLVQLAENEGLIADPDFEFRPVAWIVRLKEDGALAGIEDNRLNLNEGKTDKRGKPVMAKWVGRKALIPLFPTGRSGTKPKAAFLVDMAKFVFGRVPQEAADDPALMAYVERFRQLVLDCEAATGDPAVTVVRQMLDGVLAGKVGAVLPADATPSDLFLFKVGADSEPVHARPAVQAYWKRLRSIPPEGEEEDVRTTCLVTGVPIIGKPVLFPLIKGVPGAGTMGSGLLPFNGPSSRTWSSYGLKGNENAPVSRLAAEAAAKALNRLVDPRPTNGQGEPLPVRRLPLGEDTLAVFWSPEPAAEAQSVLDRIPDLLDPPERTEDVGNLIAAYRTGTYRPLKKSARFYAMTLAGTTGRVVVRDWFESTVKDLQGDLGAYFADLSLLRVVPGAREDGGGELRPAPLPGLAAIRSALAFDKNKVPGPLGAELWHVATTRSRRLSILFTARAIQRLKAGLAKGEDLSPAALALLKLSAVRSGDNHMSVALNKLHPEPAYHCGRLMAAIAEVQRWARRGQKNDVTVIRRFFGAAMTAPAAYFGRMLSMTERAHLPRIPRKRHRFLRDTLGEIMRSVPDELPRTLALAKQSLFALGFYHQQAKFRELPDLKYLSPTKAGVWVASFGEAVVADALTSLGPTAWP